MRPLLIFDGLCGFCSYWVSYWLHPTQDGFEAKAYQEVAVEFPDIPLERFQRQIVFVGVDGERAFGAEAAFRILAMPGGNPLWLWLYRHVPGYAPAAELAYTLVSRRREAAMRASLWLWGSERVPERHALACALFLRSTTRPEIVIEGSPDGETWSEYAFRYKPETPTAGHRGTSHTSRGWIGRCKNTSWALVC